MAEKVTTMVLKVDLDCSSCYKKVKKVLCKFPQIRNQVYDEKQNTVTVTVVCCNPEKIRDKLCRKGGKTIKSIEIKEPPKPKAPEKPKEADKPKETGKPKEADKPKETGKPKEAEKSKAPEKAKEAEKPKNPEKPKEAEKPKETEKPPQSKNPAPVDGYPQVIPAGACYGPSYYGYSWGPFYHDYGRPPPPPPPLYDGYGYGYGYGYGGKRGFYVSPCDYFSEENPTGCTIM